MGDHRVSFKFEMEFHGVKDTYEANLNWFSSEVEGVDDRMLDFIRGVYERGMGVYQEEISAYFEEQNRAETEKRERQELARLQAKYPDRK